MSKQVTRQDMPKILSSIKEMVSEIDKVDANEAETRRRVERIFDQIMGYDVMRHITREHSIQGVGDTEHCDFAVIPDKTKSAIPSMLVEIKRVGMDIMTKHLKQAASYAINIGCEWILLTNCKDWKLYHILFGQPPQTKLIESWNIMEDEPAIVLKKFDLVSYDSIRKDKLGILWKKSSVLTAQNILGILLSESSISMVRRVLKKNTDVTVTPEEIVGAIRHLLNEASLVEMDKIRITHPEKPTRKQTPTKVEQNNHELP